MDPAKRLFLFGPAGEGVDVDDPDERARLMAVDGSGAVAGARSGIRAAIAEQIATGAPPLVWATAQRLLAAGIPRADALTHLVMALSHATQSAVADDALDSVDHLYEVALGWLPLPLGADLRDAVVDVVRNVDAIMIGELPPLALARVGRPEPDPLSELMVDWILDYLIDDFGPLALLTGDRIVHVADLTAGIVLTHRLTKSERELDLLDVGFDLAGFGRVEEPHLSDGTALDAVLDDPDAPTWDGPPGWLAPYDEGDLLAVRVDPEGVVVIEALGEEPAPDPALVEVVREVYDAAVEEPWLPVEAEDLVLGVLAADRTAFEQPQASLEALCAAAGLEVRGTRVAHEASVWDSLRRLWQMQRVFDALGDADDRKAAARVLDAAEAYDATPDALRQALSDLREPAVADVVMEEVLATDRGERFSTALLAAARTPHQVGVARWVAALIAEDAGEVLVADAHLRLALEADPGSAIVVERCAWYASDRGNASEAVHLWHRIGERRADDIATVEPFARRAGPKLGRNDPCWCGSGRKYKLCHPRQQPSVPLSARVAWLCRKATSYLEHSGAEARAIVVGLALCRATAAQPDEDDLLAALADPIVIDSALTEGGWFDRFLGARGPLLPDDELLLAQSWTLVPRTVYEVVDVTPGEGLRLRDLRTEDVVDVTDRTLRREVGAGAFVCGRAVPDGEGHQLVGGLFPVAAGRESEVLDLCDEGDPEALCSYVASLDRPPVLHTREGEPLVTCTAVLELADPNAAKAVLDQTYQPDGECWVEMHPIDDDDETLRATLSMEGSRLQVVTHSEPRMDRVLGLLARELPTARVVQDERVPLAPGEMPSPPSAIGRS